MDLSVDWTGSRYLSKQTPIIIHTTCPGSRPVAGKVGSSEHRTSRIDRWTRDFREIPLLRKTAAGLVPRSAPAAYHFLSAAFQVLSHGALPGLASAVLAEVILSASCSGSKVVYDSALSGDAKAAFDTGLACLLVAGVGCAMKVKKREWNLDHVRMPNGTAAGRNLTANETKHLRGALNTTVELSDSTLGAVSALIGVYVAFDHCVTGIGPLAAAMSTTAAAVVCAVLAGGAVNSATWKRREGLTPGVALNSVNYQLRHDGTIAGAETRLDQIVEKWSGWDWAARGFVLAGAGLTVGLAYMANKNAFDAGRVAILNTIPGATASGFLANSLVDLADALHEAPRSFLPVKSEYARARRAAGLANAPRWRRAYVGVVAGTLVALGGGVAGSYFLLTHACAQAVGGGANGANSTAVSSSGTATVTSIVQVPETLPPTTILSTVLDTVLSQETVTDSSTMPAFGTNTDTVTDSDADGGTATRRNPLDATYAPTTFNTSIRT